jgi:hypothetical protein
MFKDLFKNMFGQNDSTKSEGVSSDASVA